MMKDGEVTDLMREQRKGASVYLRIFTEWSTGGGSGSELPNHSFTSCSPATDSRWREKRERAAGALCQTTLLDDDHFSGLQIPDAQASFSPLFLLDVEETSSNSFPNGSPGQPWAGSPGVVNQDPPSPRRDLARATLATPGRRAT